MMDYAFKVTTHGRAVLAACMANKTAPDICRVAFGGGKIAEDVNLADQHTLLDYVADGTMTGWRHQDDRLSFTLQYANASHPELAAFYLSEFLVSIRDPESGAETDFIYGTLGDYRQPVPRYREGLAPCLWNLPLTVVLSDELTVSVSAPSGLVTFDELREALTAAIADHDADQTAHSARYRVVAVRPRDPGKPDYGLGGGGEDGGSVALLAGPYTGATEAGVVVSGVLYDAKNLGFDGESSPDGTILMKTEEQENG